MNITGTTRIVCIIGDPVSHSLSPSMHNAAFASSGMDWAYVAFRVAPEELTGAVAGLRALGVAGFNVTMPHKNKVAQLVDELSDEARIIGAVNTVQVENGMLVGHNTDGVGLLHSLSADIGFNVAGKKVVVFGAGGASRAIVVALAQAGCAELTIVNRTQDKADILVDLVRTHFSACQVGALGVNADYAEVIRQADLIVNATSVGMHGAEDTPFDTGLISGNHIVYDIVYDPDETALLSRARARGAKALGGKRMLLYQGTAAFEIWTGRKAPVSIMETALRT